MKNYLTYFNGGITVDAYEFYRLRHHGEEVKGDNLEEGLMALLTVLADQKAGFDKDRLAQLIKTAQEARIAVLAKKK